MTESPREAADLTDFARAGRGPWHGTVDAVVGRHERPVIATLLALCLAGAPHAPSPTAGAEVDLVYGVYGALHPPRTSSVTTPPATPAPMPSPGWSREVRLLRTERAQLDLERQAVAAERRELLEVKAAIDGALRGLRAEVARLEGRAPPEPVSALSRPPRPWSRPRAQELDVLARTVRSMKPEAAIAVVQRADPNLAAALLSQFAPAERGVLLGALKPDVAARLLSLMAARPASPGGR